jgi:hypothetical protein
MFVVAAMVMALMASSPAWAALVKAADWQMDEKLDETSGTFGPMLDSSGNNNNGTPKNVVQGVQEDIDGDGEAESTYYRFNGLTTDPSRVEVPDADSLDPKANDITLTARVKVNGTSLDDDSYDVVRKGFITTEGGDYKMEIKRVKADPTIGRLHCFFRGTLEDGTDDSVARVARPDVVDGSWHTLRCEKTSDKVVATVDPGTPSERSFTTMGSADSIENANDVWVGAKTVTLTRRGVERGDDVFDGWMDFVSIEIAQQDPAQ